MGIVLDTSILIAAERRGDSPQDVLDRVLESHNESVVALSAISVVELTHGIYRARTEADRRRRRLFADDAFYGLTIHPVTLEIAQLAGRIEGEQAAVGNVIAFQDLVIGATALYLGFEVATLNVRHFERIPGLALVAL